MQTEIAEEVSTILEYDDLLLPFMGQLREQLVELHRPDMSIETYRAACSLHLQDLATRFDFLGNLVGIPQPVEDEDE